MPSQLPVPGEVIQPPGEHTTYGHLPKPVQSNCIVNVYTHRQM